MSDEIAVASLLMAILAILYGAWYSEIVRIADVEVPKHDKTALLNDAKGILYRKCLPLLILSILTSAIFTPSLISISYNALLVSMNYGLNSYQKYSSVKSAFCLVVISCYVISYQIFYLNYIIYSKCRRLKK